jgi:glycosyltransferase involved in cell wall biosynthesis
MSDPRVLVVIPAFNEEATIAAVIDDVRRRAPDYDRLVVNDCSHDATGDLVEQLGERQLRLPCNLGYGHALQTGLKYGLLCGYDVIVSFDADGQHRAEDIQPLVAALVESDAAVVIGSRYCGARSYEGPAGRRAGQILFSHLTRWLIGRRIYDTTSGFKAMRASACAMIVGGVFMDFHTETIVRLSLNGFNISEHPITVQQRLHGRSMHNYSSLVAYPLQTLLLTVVATLDALLVRRSR